MKQMKGGFQHIKGTIFPYDVVVCLGVTKENILKYFKKKFVDGLSESDKECLEITHQKGRTLQLDNRAFILWLPKYPKTPSNFGDLQHEINHVVNLMFMFMGNKLTSDCDEVTAYMTGYFTEKIYEGYGFMKKS